MNNNKKDSKVVVAKKKFFTEERKEAIKTGLKVVGVGFLSGCGTYLGLAAMSNIVSSVKAHGSSK